MWHWYYCDAVQGEESSRRTACAALRAALGALGITTLRGLRVTRGADGETYYYPDEEARRADRTGAYAWSVRLQDPEQEEG